MLGTIALLVPLSAHDVRVRIGVGDGPGDGELPFTDAAKRALEAAPHEAERLGHELAAPAHLLLALAADPEAVELSGLDPARLRDEALQHLIHPPQRFDLDRAVGDGGPVPCGSETASCRSATSAIRASMPACCWPCSGLGGASAALLREHGLDEAAVRGALGGA